jgi:intergrase/recombinase
MLQIITFVAILACPVVSFATSSSYLSTATPSYATYSATTYHNYSTEAIMSLTAYAFFAYMEKQKQERSDEIEHLTKTFTEGVRREISAALAPMDEKQKKLEDDQNIISLEQASMKDQLALIQKQLTDLLANRFQPTNPPAQVLPPSNQASAAEALEALDEEEVSSKLVSEAMRIVGFSPITRKDLEWLKTEHSIENDREAMLYAIKEFLDCEMKVPVHIIRQLNIVRVFAPAHQIDFNKLYAEFGDIQSANLVFSYARNLKPGMSVFLYIPHQFYRRFKDIDTEAYNLRNGEEKWKTKIKFGTSDLILLKKPKTGGSWTEVNLSNLSPLDLHPDSSSFPGSSSPPKGRTRKRSRRDTSEDDQEDRIAKSHKLNEDEADEEPEDPNKPQPTKYEIQSSANHLN